ncbi:MAG: methyltransferase domain-containing protein [Clostridia bacterium]|nr:methyltransferase domain-containing protein [Clostridia bacterium]
MDVTAIGAYISLLRRQRGLSQRELAARLGVSYQAVSKWENAENLPDASILLPLAAELRTTADALLSAGHARLRQPVDLNALHAGISALSTAAAVFGEDFPVSGAIADALHTMGASLADAPGRERLLTEAILHRLLRGETISDSAIDAAVQDAACRERIRKCRHDCALFADKQQLYDSCRPSYPEEAIRLIREAVGTGAVIADLGSGTGKMAALLAPWAGTLYAVEPNAHMRGLLRQNLAAFPNSRIIPATAECTRLPDRSVDAIVIAEAYHWFDGDAARAEIRRILTPGGRVFLLWNHFGGADNPNPFDQEMQALHQRHRTTPQLPRFAGAQRADALFGPGCWQRLTFDNTLRQTLPRFLGGMSSASYAPEAGTAAGEAFTRECRALFDRYAEGGLLTTRITTVCFTGIIA